MQRKMRLGLFTAIAVLIVLEGVRVFVASLDHVEVRLVQRADVIEVVEEAFVTTPEAGKLAGAAHVPRMLLLPTSMAGAPGSATPTATRTRAVEDLLRPTLGISPTRTPTATATLSDIPTRLPQDKPKEDAAGEAPENPTSVPPEGPGAIPTNTPPEAPLPTSAPPDPPTQAPPESDSPTPTSAPEVP